MSISDEKWNDSFRQLKEEPVIALCPAGIIAGNAPLPGAICGYEELRKNGGEENDKKTERDLKGEDFVWKPGLEGLEYLTILLLLIFFTRQYLDGDGRMPIQLLKEKPQ
jgi:hypothetical protein